LLILAARNISLRYNGRDEWALKEVTAQWRKGESILVLGRAGSGKSSLGKLFKGLLTPTEGRIEIVEDESVGTVAPSELLTLVGWADAQPERQIFAATVRDEVAFGPRQRNLPPDEVDRRVQKALDTVGLDFNRYQERDPLMLSGGEKRRVGLASAISSPAKFFVLDEPAAGLDPAGIKRIRDLVWKLGEEAAGVLVISHDADDFKDLVDTVWVMAGGRLKLSVPAKGADWQQLNHWLEDGGNYE